MSSVVQDDSSLFVIFKRFKHRQKPLDLGPLLGDLGRKEKKFIPEEKVAQRSIEKKIVHEL